MISILTPTFERPQLLPILYELICQQHEEDWEWLIDDDSLTPSSFFSTLKDPRVHYFYREKRASLGEKRQFLSKHAQGEILAHFDDDDYYAPSYLSKIRAHLKEADFFALSGWFCYATFNQQFFYWNLDEEIEGCFALNPIGDMMLVEGISQPLKGFGFCYAYRKKVGEELAFQDLSFGEDAAFYQEVEKRGFRIKQVPDQEGIALVMRHDVHLSRLFPQYRVPSFLCHSLFPHFKSYLEALEKLSVFQLT